MVRRLGGASSTAARSFDLNFRQELATGKLVLAGMQTAEGPATGAKLPDVAP